MPGSQSWKPAKMTSRRRATFDLVASGDMEPDFREWQIDSGDSGYVVLYRYHQQTAVILAVRHQREAGY